MPCQAHQTQSFSIRMVLGYFCDDADDKDLSCCFVLQRMFEETKFRVFSAGCISFSLSVSQFICFFSFFPVFFYCVWICLLWLNVCFCVCDSLHVCMSLHLSLFNWWFHSPSVFLCASQAVSENQSVSPWPFAYIKCIKIKTNYFCYYWLLELCNDFGQSNIWFLYWLKKRYNVLISEL